MAHLFTDPEYGTTTTVDDEGKVTTIGFGRPYVEAPVMNYRDLLKKYLEIVMSCESVDFLDGFYVHKIDISEQELEELKRLSDEVINDKFSSE